MKQFFLLLAILLQWGPCLKAQGTVVGIHGFLLDSRSMISVKNILESNCLNVCLWDYDSKSYRFCCHARHLVEYLNFIAANKPGEPIDFVTHSTGAIILRAALNLPYCPKEAKMGRAVLIAPPNRGSSLARKFRKNPLVQWSMGTESGCELMNYCPTDILTLGSFPHSMEVLVVAGCRGINVFFDGRQNDRWLAVEETYLETPHIHRTFYNTHGGLLVSPNVHCLMLDFLFSERTHLEEEISGDG